MKSETIKEIHIYGNDHEFAIIHIEIKIDENKDIVDIKNWYSCNLKNANEEDEEFYSAAFIFVEGILNYCEATLSDGLSYKRFLSNLKYSLEGFFEDSLYFEEI